MLSYNKLYLKNSLLKYYHGDEYQLNYLKDSIYDLVERCNIFMTINISKDQ